MEHSFFQKIRASQLSRSELKSIMGGYLSTCTINQCPGGGQGFSVDCGSGSTCTAEDFCLYCDGSPPQVAAEQCCPFI